MRRWRERRGGAGAAAFRFLVLSLVMWVGFRLALTGQAPGAPETSARAAAPGAGVRAPAETALAGWRHRPPPTAEAWRLAVRLPETEPGRRAAAIAAFNSIPPPPPSPPPLAADLQASVIAGEGAAAAGDPPDPAAAPHGAGPYWAAAPAGTPRDLSGWSGDAWLYLRPGAAPGQGGLLASGQLGGSQAGARLSYGFGPTGRWRLHGRATTALARARQREVAIGVTVAPRLGLPVDLVVERRIAVGPEGRNAVAAMLVGGIGDLALPGDFRLDAYAQMGVVGAKRRDLFGDGALVIDRQIATGRLASLRVGGVAAAAAQPSAARADVGPRLSLDLPEVAGGSRLALDWRYRLMGDAQPGSGLAVTLATHF